MCGRFALTASAEEIQAHFDLPMAPVNLEARYNIAPSQDVLVVIEDEGRKLDAYRWGLIPSWAKDMSMGNKLINARSETVAEKPSFRQAFASRRCLIPASGFYEWKAEDGQKVPYYISLKDTDVFAFAGLWEKWRDGEGQAIYSCTILTAEPNDLIRPLHNRQAVIVHPGDYDLWLSNEVLEAGDQERLFRAFEAKRMQYHEVSPMMNNPSYDSADNIKPFESPKQQTLL